MKKKLTVLCTGGGLCECPQVFVDDEAIASQKISIADDFGNTILMSEEQLSEFVRQAKAGILEV